MGLFGLLALDKLERMERRNQQRKMVARYVGKTEYYDKVSNCPPVTLVNGQLYQISVKPRDFASGWDIVRIYDTRGNYLTWVPYSVSYKLYWEIQ